MFNQHRYPRFNRETLLPVAQNDPYEPAEGWYPPGHGDVYRCLEEAGLIAHFKELGKETQNLSIDKIIEIITKQKVSN